MTAKWDEIMKIYPHVDCGNIRPLTNKKWMYQLVSTPLDVNGCNWDWYPSSIDAIKERLEELGIKFEWLSNSWVIKLSNDEDDATFRFYFAELITN